MTQQTYLASTSFVVPAGVTKLDDLLAVGGGGGGAMGNSNNGVGGGGAGRVKHLTNVTVVPGETLTITIGAGGAGAAALGDGTNGGNTTVVGSVSGTLVTAVGGGGGGRFPATNTAPNGEGKAGGSGGGGGTSNSGSYNALGGAATGGNVAGEGNAGGNGNGSTTISGRRGGGGGGANAAGTSGASGIGTGGAGVNKSATFGTIGGAAGVFGGGGGGSTQTGSAVAGGAGGGGAAGDSQVGGHPATAGVANTGGGGGAGYGANAGAAGGSGIVSFTYTIAAPDVPSGVTISDSDTDSLTLFWSAPLTGGPVDHYEVRIDGGAPTSPATAPHVFSGLSPETSYDLEVRSVGPGGNSAWVLVSGSTLIVTPPGYYRVDLVLGSHSWSIVHDDAPAYGPILPLTLGWDIADSVEFFPAQAGITTLQFAVQTHDASDLADVVKGTTVEFDMYVDANVGADPWQTFRGVVTQLDGEVVDGVEDAETKDFRVTVYAGDDTIRLADMYVGYGSDWPIESIYDRVGRICTEAGLSRDDVAAGGLFGTGQAGWLAARTAGQPVAVYDALKAALKDAADDYTSEPPNEYYGRYVFGYHPADPDNSDLDTVRVSVFRRRLFGTTFLDGGLVRAASNWTKQPGPHMATWVIVDGTEFGTPSGVPFVRNTNLIDYTGSPPGSLPNYSATEKDSLGESLLADGSTGLDGWSTRLLRYEASHAPEPCELWASFAPPTYPIAVTVTPVAAELEVNGVDYVAGTLTAARLVIPPGGKFAIEFRLRAELLPGHDVTP